MKKIAIFLGDFFWSSIPYDGLELLSMLRLATKNTAAVDLLMFEKDIRLNKVFAGNEKFRFETSAFKEHHPITLKNWGELEKISDDYSLIVTSTHIAPKHRYPHQLKKNIKCGLAVWDIGGSDILTNAVHFATTFFVKGPIWKTWLEQLGHTDKNIAITGSPHYDNYSNFNKANARKSICTKYAILEHKMIVLITPSNTSHHDQYKQNLNLFEQLYNHKNIHILIKTYPHDYVFYENEAQYSGICRRPTGNKPLYELIKTQFPQTTVINSEDHFLAMMGSDAIFNISGSHIAWETYLTQTKCFTSNYETQKYYKNVSYLPKEIIYPDHLVNIHIDKIEDIFDNKTMPDFSKMNSYIMKPEYSATQNICNILINKYY
jgi:hypothetical protein